MKLDILMKLIALANNNPNDNEANLAARKACKAISEGKFTITEGIQRTKEPNFKSTPPNTGQSQSNYRPHPGSQEHYYNDPYDIFNEYFRRGGFSGGFGGGGKTRTNEEKQKQHEDYQKYKSRSDELRERENTWSYEYYVAANDQYWNPLTRKHYNKMFQDLWYEEIGTRHYSDTAAFRSICKYYGQPQDKQKKSNPYTDNTYKHKKHKDSKDRYLKCKTCGNHFITKFVGLEELFECNTCQWTAFEKGKKPPKEEKNYGHVCHMTGKKCNTPVTCAGMGCQFSKR